MTAGTFTHDEHGEAPALDVERVRRDFPALHQEVHGKPLSYLDNAATSQKPEPVLEAVQTFYRRDTSNVHRGVHELSSRATRAYEAARERMRRYVGAADASEIVFARGTTEGINLVANTFGRARIREGDEVLLTEMEHHSNIVPWQMLCDAHGATLRVARVTDRGEVDLEDFEAKLGSRTRIAAFPHISNALGTVNPAGEMVRLAHAHDAAVLIDGAQAAPHAPIDVQELDADFYVLSGHKMYGPSGIGVLYGKRALLDEMPPWQGGGDMIETVRFDGTTYAEPPAKFEAGTPNVAGAIGLGAAAEYVMGLDREAIAAHERELLAYATERVERIDGLTLVGTAPSKVAVLSFVMEGAHPHDIATILDQEGVAVRAGHHCTQPLMRRFEVAATARASLGVYNTRADVDRLLEGLATVQKIFG